ncbi:hypothetical protein [Komagataeibacter saccharivorans]|uniref:Uncharacterized protein n=1 Tax=Komagataeibacter saccharivorans TaxID=265959 RepID=A0A347WAX5_9PROT|nr:hypothetical protein [Komagataeibacter saccharivorans]AXY22018.1 hypothetical protein CD178_01234 [Komagataeibacter saccharivorans]
MSLSTHTPAPSPVQGTQAPMPRMVPDAAPAPLPLTWMGRAWWQRLVCMAGPCAVLWGLIAWAVAQP